MVHVTDCPYRGNPTGAAPWVKLLLLGPILSIQVKEGQSTSPGGVNSMWSLTPWARIGGAEGGVDKEVSVGLRAARTKQAVKLSGASCYRDPTEQQAG